MKSRVYHFLPRGASTVFALAFLTGSSIANDQPVSHPIILPQTEIQYFPLSTLKNIDALQIKVTIHSQNEPLEEMLAKLSATVPFEISARRPISDQRVNLHVTDTPLWVVMENLQGLLSHDVPTGSGYYWEAFTPGNSKERARYRLQRTAASENAERAERDAPRLRAIQLLREWRDVLHMSPQELALYKGEIPRSYYARPDADYNRAIAVLTDDMIEKLGAGQLVPVNQKEFAAEIESYQRRMRALLEISRQRSIEANGKDPYPRGITLPNDGLGMLRFRPNDFSGDRPNMAHEYLLNFAGLDFNPSGPLSEPGMTLDTKRPEFKNPFADTPETKEKIYDLAPLLLAKEVTAEQRSDFGFVLTTLSKLTGVNVYQEQFYKLNTFGGPIGAAPTMLRPENMKGTLPQLLNSLCKVWEYNGKQVGNDYVLWSTTWAQDRAADISERKLKNWRVRSERQKKQFTDADRMQITAEFTWPQVRITLAQLLPESAPEPFKQWNSINAYYQYRTQAMLAPGERQAALQTEGGIPFASLSPVARNAIMEAGAALGRVSDMRVTRSTQEIERLLQGGAQVIMMDYSATLKGDGVVYLSVKLPGGESLW